MAKQTDKQKKLEEALDKDPTARRGRRGRAPRILLNQPGQSVTDRLWLTVVAGLTAALVLGVAGLIVLAALGKSTEGVLPALTGIIGLLGGMFLTPPESAE